MFHLHRLLSKASLAAAVLSAAALLPNASTAGQALVENYSNDDVCVAIAYRTYKGTSDLAVEGWFKIGPNERRTFQAADADDMHLRILRNGQEVVFPKHQQFRRWPVTNAGFTVSKEPDDVTIRVLRWNNSRRNVMFQEPLPPSWSHERFFRIGAQNARLEIRP